VFFSEENDGYEIFAAENRTNHSSGTNPLSLGVENDGDEIVSAENRISYSSSTNPLSLYQRAK
jgi:hypothetical protein